MAGETTHRTYRAASPSARAKDKAEILEFTIVADAADGSVASLQTTKAVFGFVELVTSIPGSTLPTNLWGFSLKDEDGVDILGGEGASRAQTAEQIIPLVGSAYAPRRVDSKLTLSATGNSVNSANIVIKAYVIRDN